MTRAERLAVLETQLAALVSQFFEAGAEAALSMNGWAPAESKWIARAHSLACRIEAFVKDCRAPRGTGKVL